MEIEDKSGITPKGDLVLLLCPPVQAVTAGGVIIPQEAQERHAKSTRIGYFLAMGPDAAVDPRCEGFKFGDLVLIPRYAADFVPIDGVEYLLLKAASILAHLTKMPDFQFQKTAQSPTKVFGANAAPESPRIARLG